MDFEKIKENMVKDLDAYSMTHFTEVLGLDVIPLAEADYHTVLDTDLIAYELPLHVVQQQYPRQINQGSVMLQTMSGESWNSDYAINRDTVRELFRDKVYVVREKAGV